MTEMRGIHLRPPHANQAAFVDCKAKRIIIRAGRRGGKTVGVAIKALVMFLGGRRVLYAAPTSEQTDRFWYEIVTALADPIAEGALTLNKSERFIEVPGTLNRIKAKTAWDADSLRGDFADLLIFDEWQLSNEDAWEIVGYPMLMDNNGDAVFIYTPPSLRSAGISKAHDPRHAAKMFKAAGEDGSGRWARFHFTSLDNPYISREGLAEAMKDASTASYRQEILAEDDELSASHLVYGVWNDNRKCRRFEIPDTWPKFSGHDFGSANPAALFIARVKLPLPSGAPAEMRYGDIVSFAEYLPGRGQSTAVNVDAFKLIAPKVQASAGGNHNEDGSRGDYSKSGWTILEPPIGSEGGPSLKRQVDRVVAIMEAGKYWVFETNVFELAELASCAWKYDKEGNRTNEIDGEQRYHLCFVAGTMVQTIGGQKPIENIRQGDLVATRQGYHPVLVSGMTQVADTLEVQFSDGSMLRGTGNHPVWVKGKGFVSLTCLRYNDTIESWKENALYSPGNHITDTRRPNENLTGCTSRIRGNISIGRFGNRLMGLFLKGATFITRMGIGQITISPTLNQSLCLSMRGYTTREFVQSPNSNISEELRVWEPLGHRQQKDVCGSEQFVKTNLVPNQQLDSVNSAVSNSNHLAIPPNFVLTNVNPSIAGSREQTTKQEYARCVARTSPSIDTREQKPVPVRVVGVSASNKTTVYNLSVDAVHEYYANGILVSNCACRRYVLSLSDFTPETVHRSGSTTLRVITPGIQNRRQIAVR